MVALLSVVTAPAFAQGTVMPVPRAAFYDNNGAPCNGCTLDAWAAGTTTPQATYSDAALTTANANPVVLDSAGRATIFLSATSYRFRLSTSAGVVLWTQDNIDSVPSGNGLNADILGTVNAAVSARDCLVLSNGDGSRTAGQWYRCDADDADVSARPEFVGFAVNAISASGSGLIRIKGAMGSFSGLTAGSTYYMSGTAGSITATVPTTTYPRIVGVASSSTVLDIAPRQPIALDNTTTKTTTYTALVTDQQILANSASDFTITLYAATGNVGRRLFIKNISTGDLTISRAGSDTIDGLTSIILRTQYDWAILEVSTASTWSVVARSVDFQVFTATGANTWTRPAGAKFVEVVVVAGGGGGGSGRRGAAGSARVGGQGGAGGGWARQVFLASLLSATETATVGAGGAGGAAVSADNTNGNAGTTGGNSSFGAWLRATGGTAGDGGTNTTPTTTTAGFGLSDGGGGGRVSGSSDGIGGASRMGGGGGGQGGGITAADAYGTGTSVSIGAGGTAAVGSRAGGTAGTDGSTAGGAGTAATANDASGGAGGGGGGANTAAAAFIGGVGGIYGGGGGGGGASVNATGASGAGGAGGNGIVIVITYF